MDGENKFPKDGNENKISKNDNYEVGYKKPPKCGQFPKGTSGNPKGLGLYFANPDNPQSVSLYSYVMNNPLIVTNSDGLRCVWDDGSFDSEKDPDTDEYAGAIVNK